MIKQGWQGRFFEDFEVGDVYEHPLGRTVLPVDNSWFTLLTQNTAPGAPSSIQISPPWASTASLQKVSPRPRPVLLTSVSPLST